MKLHDRAGEPVEVSPLLVDYVFATGGPGREWRATVYWRPPNRKYPAQLKVREPKELIDAMMAKRVSGRGA